MVLCYTRGWAVFKELERGAKMIDFNNKKTQRTISAVIVIVLVVAMVATSILPYIY